MREWEGASAHPSSNPTLAFFSPAWLIQSSLGLCDYCCPTMWSTQTAGIPFTTYTNYPNTQLNYVVGLKAVTESKRKNLKAVCGCRVWCSGVGGGHLGCELTQENVQVTFRAAPWTCKVTPCQSNPRQVISGRWGDQFICTPNLQENSSDGTKLLCVDS